jgi:hypothetical protein
LLNGDFVAGALGGVDVFQQHDRAVDEIHLLGLGAVGEFVECDRAVGAEDDVDAWGRWGDLVFGHSVHLAIRYGYWVPVVRLARRRLARSVV